MEDEAGLREQETEKWEDEAGLREQETEKWEEVGLREQETDEWEEAGLTKQEANRVHMESNELEEDEDEAALKEERYMCYIIVCYIID